MTNTIELHRVDLNLLVAFDVLMREKNVTNAAKQLFVSQSAMSYTLKRLRALFDDPLLIPTRYGMQATPRALDLEPAVHECLKTIQLALTPQLEFTPAESHHRFVLGSTDYTEYVFLPPLMSHLAQVAPGVDICLRRFELSEAESHLENGDIDLAIRFRGEAISKHINIYALADEMPVVLLRRDHKTVTDTLDIEQYATLAHIAIDSMELTEDIDRKLAEVGLNRRVQLQAPNFLSAPVILAESDMIATMPRFIAERFIRGGRLKIMSLPVELGSFPLKMFWHQLKERDPAQQWFREQIKKIASSLVADV